MSLYTIRRRDQPHQVLFLSPSLTAIGEALAAQPDADGLVVNFNQDGFSRDLNDEERIRLASLLPG